MNSLADGYAARQMPRSLGAAGAAAAAKLPAAPDGLSPAGERGIRPPLASIYFG
ncbi:MAG TPA: hypothetical protein GYA08_00120 [Chloroflexi bacterium]|nr:hypothetical protein [Chloroflexota bacterium]